MRLLNAMPQRLPPCILGQVPESKLEGLRSILMKAVVGIILEDLKVFADANRNGLYDAGEEVYQKYAFTIFISKDVSYLRKVFDNLDPGEGDVCIFLEDNSSRYL